jgi:hypothetical protein
MNLQDISKKTMNVLCKELKDLSTTKTPLPKPITKTPLPKPCTKTPLPKPITKTPLPKPITKTPLPKPFTKTPLPKPCGKAFVKKGGYSRKELEEMAKKQGIKNISKKNMEVLCKEVLSKTIQVVKPISKTPKILKMIHKKDPNAFKPNYTFDQDKKSWVFVAGSPSVVYKESVLKNMTTETILELLNEEYQLQISDPMNHTQAINLFLKFQYAKILLSKKTRHLTNDEIIKIVRMLNTNGKDLSTSNRSLLLNMILKPSKSQIPHHEISHISKLLKSDLKPEQMTTIPPNKSLMQVLFPKEFRFLYSSQKNKSVKSFTKKLLQLKSLKETKTKHAFEISYGTYSGHMDKNITYKCRRITLSGYRNLPKNMVGADITGIKNNASWFQDQINYQKKMDRMKQLIVFSYTHMGDKLIHSWMQDKFLRKQFESTFFDKYMTGKLVMFMIPLLNLMYRNNSSKTRSIINNGFPNSKKEEIDQFISYIENANKSPKMYQSKLSWIVPAIQDANRSAVIWLNRNLPKAKMTFYDEMFKNYERVLNDIIEKSPVLKHKLIVYKGVQTDEFLKFDKTNNYFDNKFFISTSIDLNVANKFSRSECCLIKMTILKGTKCLLPIFTYYHTEREILFPTKRKYYLTMSKYKPLNSKKSAWNVVVVN